VPQLTSRTVASHDRSSSNRTRRTNWTERTNWIQGEEWRGENKPRCEQTEHDVSRGTHHVINPSRPAPSPVFVLQATKAGLGGLGMRLVCSHVFRLLKSSCCWQFNCHFVLFLTSIQSWEGIHHGWPINFTSNMQSCAWPTYVPWVVLLSQLGGVGQFTQEWLHSSLLS